MDYPYLVAIALIKEKGSRAMPIGGKSLKESIRVNDDPGEIGENLAKELLIRVFQRSEKGNLRRAAGDRSLMLIQISMELMQEKIPYIISAQISKIN